MKNLLMSIAAGPGVGFGDGEGHDLHRRNHDSACAKGGGHESMFKKMGTDDPKACTETCIKGGSNYVLFEADKTFYLMDDFIRSSSSRGRKSR